MKPSRFLFAPIPRRLNSLGGWFRMPSTGNIVLPGRRPNELVFAAEKLKSRLGEGWRITASQAARSLKKPIVLDMDPAAARPPEGYSLEVKENGIVIAAPRPAGIYYGVCTFLQLLASDPQRIPCLSVVDWPDFPVRCVKFAESGLEFHVCPGTSSWNSITGRTENAINNLRNAGVQGLAAGATGFLNTDWGDNGHLHYLPVSYLGFLYGACSSWNADSLAIREPSTINLQPPRRVKRLSPAKPACAPPKSSTPTHSPAVRLADGRPWSRRSPAMRGWAGLSTLSLRK